LRGAPALRDLMAGNERFAADQLTSIEHDLKILKDHMRKR